MATPPDPLAVAAAQQAVNPQSPDLGQPQTATPVLADQSRNRLPLAAEFIRNMIKPPMQAQPGQLARPMSRTGEFESFLTNFVSALGQGMQQSGQRGAEFKGFGAAVGAPRQIAMQNQQLQNQTAVSQGQAANLKAEAGLRQAQAAPVQVPGINGAIPAGSVPTIYRGFPAAQVGAEAKVKVADIQAANKLQAIQLQTLITANKGTKFIADVDGKGQPFYHIMNPFGRELGVMDVNAIRQFMATQSNTVQFMPGEDGSIQALPKTTTNVPVLPGNRGGSAGPLLHTPSGVVPGVSQTNRPSGFPNAGGGGQKFWATSSSDGIHATPVMGKDGKPMFAKAPDNIRTMAYTAKATLPHVDTLSTELGEMEKLGVLGQFQGKMSQALTGRGFRIPGLSDPQMQAVGKFLNDVKLMDSAMLRTHFGARGGQEMYEKFSDMLNAGEDPNLMRGGLASFKDYLTGYSQMGGMNPSAANPVDSLVSKYK